MDHPSVIVFGKQTIPQSQYEQQTIELSSSPFTSTSLLTGTHFLLPSPSSSPVCPRTPQRVIHILQPGSSLLSSTTTPVTTDVGRSQSMASSPLPPAYPWNHWQETSVQLSPVSPDRSSSPLRRSDDCLDSVNSSGGIRRGRPRLDDISILIKESVESPSGIRCTYCSRVFPREKSLQVNILES